MPITRIDTRIEVILSEAGNGTTTMTIVSTFASTEAMAQMVEMGMEEGMQAAMSQIDEVLAEAA